MVRDDQIETVRLGQPHARMTEVEQRVDDRGASVGRFQLLYRLALRGSRSRECSQPDIEVD